MLVFVVNSVCVFCADNIVIIIGLGSAVILISIILIVCVVHLKSNVKVNWLNSERIFLFIAADSLTALIGRMTARAKYDIISVFKYKSIWIERRKTSSKNVFLHTADYFPLHASHDLNFSQLNTSYQQKCCGSWYCTSVFIWAGQLVFIILTVLRFTYIGFYNVFFTLENVTIILDVHHYFQKSHRIHGNTMDVEANEAAPGEGRMMLNECEGMPGTFEFHRTSANNYIHLLQNRPENNLPANNYQIPVNYPYPIYQNLSSWWTGDYRIDHSHCGVSCSLRPDVFRKNTVGVANVSAMFSAELTFARSIITLISNIS